MSMQNNPTYNKQEDFFAEKIKERLENYEFPVEQNTWDELKPLLKKKKVVVWPWLLGISIAVAATITIISILYSDSAKNLTGNQIEHIQEPNHNIPDKQQSSNQQIHYNKPSQENNNTQQTDIIHEQKKTKEIEKQLPLSTKATIEKNKLNNNISVTERNNEKPLKNTNKTGPNLFDGQRSSAQNTYLADTAQNKPEEKTITTDANQDKQEETTTLQSNVNNQHSSEGKAIAQYLSTEEIEETTITPIDSQDVDARQYTDKHLVTQKKGIDKYTTNKKATTIVKDNKNNHWYLAAMISFNDVPDFSKFPTMSIGMTIRKDISKRFGIKSGLIYSHLSTNYKETKDDPLSATSDLHYIGIPVNGIVSIWNYSKWDIYFSPGFMVEKGIKHVYTQYIYEPSEVTNDIITTTKKENRKINGIQWSLNASFGVAYKFYRGLGVFLEPGCYYYFDNNQPSSIYTDKRFSLGVIGGLQYEF